MLNDELLNLLPTDMKRRTCLIDANLIVLLITAAVDTQLLKTFKRVRNFSLDDVLLLQWIILQFQAVVTTSYALAEASNLGNELSGWKRKLWYQALADFAKTVPEAHIGTNLVGASSLAEPFGITDAALGELCERHVLITAEYRLSGHLTSLGKVTINFNHLRPIWMV